MCIVCKEITKINHLNISGMKFALTPDTDICLDHLAAVCCGVESMAKFSKETLVKQGVSDDDRLILNYIRQFGLKAYNNEVVKAYNNASADLNHAPRQVLLEAIRKEIADDDSIGNEEVLRSPRKIKEYLDQYVIGQDQAKESLSIAIHDHWLRTMKDASRNNKKSNVLVIGPSGTGKTYLIETLSRLLGVPFASVNASNLTASGYQGESVTDVVKTLFQRSGNDIEKTQRGIIYLDEIDKIAGAASVSRDVKGMDVQRELLCIVQGMKMQITVQTNHSMMPQQVEIDTSNILFICSGAFLEMKERLKLTKRSRIGFNAVEEGDGTSSLSEVLELPTVEDFINYGMDPQFMGRFPIITGVKELTKNDLRRIVKEPKDSLLSEYVEKFNLDDVNFKLTDDAVDAVVDQAIKEGTGARGLRRIFEAVLAPYRFAIEDYQGEVDEDGNTINNDLVISEKEVKDCFTKKNKKVDSLVASLEKETPLGAMPKVSEGSFEAPPAPAGTVEQF